MNYGKQRVMNFKDLLEKYVKNKKGNWNLKDSGYKKHRRDSRKVKDILSKKVYCGLMDDEIVSLEVKECGNDEFEIWLDDTRYYHFKIFKSRSKTG